MIPDISARLSVLLGCFCLKSTTLLVFTKLYFPSISHVTLLNYVIPLSVFTIWEEGSTIVMLILSKVCWSKMPFFEKNAINLMLEPMYVVFSRMTETSGCVFDSTN